MRKGEKSLIMVKPRFGYDHEHFGNKVQFPSGWNSSLEREKTFKTRRAFFEIQLFDWTVRHDLIGDGTILKTILKRGTGYDRPEQYDEATIDLKIS